MNKLLILLAFFCLKVDGQVLNIFPDEPVSAWHPGSVLNLFGNYMSRYEWDKDAVKFLDSAGVTGYESRYKLNEFVKDLKAINNTQTNFVDFDTLSVSVLKAVWPIIDSTAESQKWNLMNPQNTDAAYRLSFVGSPVHENNGLILDGISQYANTFYNTNGITKISQGVWIKNNIKPTIGNYFCLLGNTNSTTNNRVMLYLGYNDVVNSTIYDEKFDNVPTHGQILYYKSNVDGFHSSSMDSGLHYLYYNGISQNSIIETAFSSGPDYSLFLGSSNRWNTPGQFLNNTVNFAFIGNNITQEAMYLYYLAVYRYIYDSSYIERELSTIYEDDDIYYKYTSVNIVDWKGDLMLGNIGDFIFYSKDNGHNCTYKYIDGFSDMQMGHIFENGNVIFANTTDIYISNDGLMTVTEPVIHNPDGTIFTAQSAGSNYRITCKDRPMYMGGHEVLFWGNYGNVTTDYVESNIFYTLNYGEDINICYKFGIYEGLGDPDNPIIVRHVHGIAFDGDSLWCYTGDENMYSKILRGYYDQNLDTIKFIIALENNYMYAQLGGVFFENDTAYISIDASGNAGLFKSQQDKIVDFSNWSDIYTTDPTLACVGLYVNDNEVVAGKYGPSTKLQTILISKDYGNTVIAKEFTSSFFTNKSVLVYLLNNDWYLCRLTASPFLMNAGTLLIKLK